MANANANLVEILKDINNVDDDDDSKANVIVEEVSAGEIHEAQVSSNHPSTTEAGNDEIKDQPDEDDSKGEMSACDDTDEEEEEEEEMNYDEEAMEELISNLHIGELPTIGKEAKNGASPLNNLRCQCAKRGRSTLLLFYRLWRDHLVKKPPPPPPPPRPL